MNMLLIKGGTVKTITQGDIKDGEILIDEGKNLPQKNCCFVYVIIICFSQCSVNIENNEPDFFYIHIFYYNQKKNNKV